MAPTDDMLAGEATPLDPPARWTAEPYDPERDDPSADGEHACFDGDDPPDLPPEEA